MLESLESRRLFAVTVNLFSGLGVLKLTGDASADYVRLELFGKTQFKLSTSADPAAPSMTYDLATVTRIQFDSGAGADTIIMGNVPIPLLAATGKGDDSISGGLGNDTLIGQGGEDYVFGSAGDDSLNGGLQGDTLFGGDGDDTIAGFSDTSTRDLISGGAGGDTVTFEGKTDGPVTIRVGELDPNAVVADYVLGDIETLIGTNGADTLSSIAGTSLVIFGLAGGDRIELGRGTDRLIGGLGDDTLLGGPGDDFFDVTGGGADQLFGGAGTDVATGVTGDDILDSVNVQV